MIKLIHEISRNNFSKYKKSERSAQKPLKISWQSVLIPRKISVLFTRNVAKYIWNYRKVLFFRAGKEGNMLLPVRRKSSQIKSPNILVKNI
jgi:hypothetical protein